MLFDVIPPDSNSLIRIEVNRVSNYTNSGFNEFVSKYKYSWLVFWDRDKTQQQLQAELDLRAVTPTKNGTSNALADCFANARATFEYILTLDPTAFNDALSTEDEQYTQFMTPGWTFTTEESGRIVVGEPCQWVTPEV